MLWVSADLSGFRGGPRTGSGNPLQLCAEPVR